MNEWIWHFSDYCISLFTNFDWKDNFLKLYSVQIFSFRYVFIYFFFILLSWKVIKSFLKLNPQPHQIYYQIFCIFLKYYDKKYNCLKLFKNSEQFLASLRKLWIYFYIIFFFNRIKYTSKTTKWGLVNISNI